jgi:hypothetical protein
MPHFATSSTSGPLRSILSGPTTEFGGTAVLGFALGHPSTLPAWGAAAPPRGAAAPPRPLSYRSAAPFPVPKHRLTPARTFSLQRALAAGSASSSGSAGSASDGGAASTASSPPPPDGGGGGGAAGRLLSRARILRKAFGDGGAGQEVRWQLDVGGYTRKGYIAGGGKDENQDR